MFQLPAILSFAGDFLIIVIYFSDKQRFGDRGQFPINSETFNVQRSHFLLILFAALRMLFFLPYVVQYQANRRLRLGKPFLAWMIANVAVMAWEIVVELLAYRSPLPLYMRCVIVGEGCLSVLCQWICVQHLKSTAVPLRQIAFGIAERLNHRLDASFLLAHPSPRSIGSPTQTHTSSPASRSHYPYRQDQNLVTLNQHPHQRSQLYSDFLQKLHIARRVWERKQRELLVVLGKLQTAIETGSAVDFTSKEAKDTFEVILRLYVDDTAFELLAYNISDLEYTFLEYPEEVEFYVPQLVTFLIYGSFSHGRELRALLLRLCRKRFTFCYRLLWFLRSFCLDEEAGLDADAVAAIEGFIAEICDNGAYAVQSVLALPEDQQAALDVTSTEMVVQEGHGVGGNWAVSGSGAERLEVGNRLTEHLDDIERPNHSEGSAHRGGMDKVMAHAEQNKNRRENVTEAGGMFSQGSFLGRSSLGSFFWGLGSAAEQIESDVQKGEEKTLLLGKSESEMQRTPKNGVYGTIGTKTVPTAEGEQGMFPSLSKAPSHTQDNSAPSPRGSSRSADATYAHALHFAPPPPLRLQYPMRMTKTRESPAKYFNETLDFWAKMTDISRELTQVPREKRSFEMQKLIAQACSEFLPSASIHVPVSTNVNHRVWALHPMECRVFNTKERAPILLCVEVVHFERLKKRFTSQRMPAQDSNASAAKAAKGRGGVSPASTASSRVSLPIPFKGSHASTTTHALPHSAGSTAKTCLLEPDSLFPTLQQTDPQVDGRREVTVQQNPAQPMDPSSSSFTVSSSWWDELSLSHLSHLGEHMARLASSTFGSAQIAEAGVAVAESLSIAQAEVGHSSSPAGSDKYLTAELEPDIESALTMQGPLPRPTAPPSSRPSTRMGMSEGEGGGKKGLFVCREKDRAEMGSSKEEIQLRAEWQIEGEADRHTGRDSDASTAAATTTTMIEGDRTPRDGKGAAAGDGSKESFDRSSSRSKNGRGARYGWISQSREDLAALDTDDIDDYVDRQAEIKHAATLTPAPPPALAHAPPHTHAPSLQLYASHHHRHHHHQRTSAVKSAVKPLPSAVRPKECTTEGEGRSLTAGTVGSVGCNVQQQATSSTDTLESLAYSASPHKSNDSSPQHSIKMGNDLQECSLVSQAERLPVPSIHTQFFPSTDTHPCLGASENNMDVHPGNFGVLGTSRIGDTGLRDESCQPLQENEQKFYDFSPKSSNISSFPPYFDTHPHHCPASSISTLGIEQDRELERESEVDLDSSLSTTEITTVAPVVFKEKWRRKEDRIRAESVVGRLPGWRLLAVIVKSNDDLRQEQCAAQAIQEMHSILKKSKRGMKCWLRPYNIIAISPDCGIMEAIPDTVSLSILKRQEFGYDTLLDFFLDYFGPRSSRRFQQAQQNFIKSLAGYCIVCYLLHIKDRHNGNILATTHGHLIHIDFGFFLGNTPGGNIGFERAPFKLTQEFIDVIGGVHSQNFQTFRRICVETFMELRRNHHRVVLLLQMMSKGNESLPCFVGNPQRVLEDLRCRFLPDLNDKAAAEAVHSLIDQSIDNWTTTLYDRYQRFSTGIF